tara:strand:+ start:421 stop:1047 length:627 start_codon:yes stop_codon:yes gene_type:complete
VANLIKINLNQTVSKTELKEKKADTLKWVLFAFIAAGFLSLMIFQAIVIIKSNNISDELAEFKSHLSQKIGNDKGLSGTSHEDIKKLKEFEESKRVFWGPKLVSLIELLPDDVAISKIQFTKGKNFKMEFFARYDNIEIDDEKTLFLKGSQILESLKNSDFMDGFESLSAVKNTLEKKKDVELVKFTIEGTVREVLTKSRKKRKKKKK